MIEEKAENNAECSHNLIINEFLTLQPYVCITVFCLTKKEERK